jgi:peptide chain release factor 3
MQFEVAAHRMDAEFGVEIILDRLPYSTVGRVDNPEHRLIIDRANRSEVLQRSDGVHLGLFADDIALGVLRRMNPELEIETLVSGM